MGPLVPACLSVPRALTTGLDGPAVGAGVDVRVAVGVALAATGTGLRVLDGDGEGSARATLPGVADAVAAATGGLTVAVGDVLPPLPNHPFGRTTKRNAS